jgi:pyrimidine deaminase RibD-like protein
MLSQSQVRGNPMASGVVESTLLDMALCRTAYHAMMAAATESQKSTMIHGLGCVCVVNHTIVSRGYNHHSGQDDSMHAEESALDSLMIAQKSESKFEAGEGDTVYLQGH